VANVQQLLFLQELEDSWGSYTSMAPRYWSFFILYVCIYICNSVAVTNSRHRRKMFVNFYFRSFFKMPNSQFLFKCQTVCCDCWCVNYLNAKRLHIIRIYKATPLLNGYSDGASASISNSSSSSSSSRANTPTRMLSSSASTSTSTSTSASSSISGSGSSYNISMSNREEADLLAAVQSSRFEVLEWIVE
jgi:hypothetical protein